MEIINCSTIHEVNVGDTVYMRPTGNARYWHPREPFVRGTVRKIGKKYFTVSRGHDGIHAGTDERFTLDGAQCVCDGTYGYILYASKEEFDRDTERDGKFAEIRTYFGQSFRKKDPSYETICKIHKLMREEGLL